MCKKETIIKRLETLALKGTIPFCRSCFKKAPTGRCPQCKTDDLMKLHEETGCEYGVDWYIPEILKNHLEPVNEERIFKAMIEDCYPNNTRVAWIKLNTVEILKEVCPCDWETACNDYISDLEANEQLISFDDGSTYYWANELEKFIGEKLKQGEASL